MWFGVCCWDEFDCDNICDVMFNVDAGTCMLLVRRTFQDGEKVSSPLEEDGTIVGPVDHPEDDELIPETE